MKKKILLLAAVAMCVAILASGTLAYFTAEDEVHNVITSGAVDIQIEEWQSTDDGLVAYPADPIAVMPGAEVSKIVTVRNFEAESWIRARYEVLFYDPAGELMDLTPAELSAIVDVPENEDAWTQDSGWWYFNTAVVEGDATLPLFTTVNFHAENMTNEYQNCTVEVVVTAQAVQTANNGGSVMEAAGWPEE